MQERILLPILKIIVIIVFFVLVVQMGLLPLHSKTLRSRPMLKALSSTFTGCLFLNVALLHILPESQEILSQYLRGGKDVEVFPLASLLLILGFSVTLFFTKVLVFHQHDQHEAGHQQRQWGTEMKQASLDQQLVEKTPQVQDLQKQKPADKSKQQEAFFLTMAMYFHTIFEGIAIGVQTSVTGFLSTALAISFHKWADAFSMGLHYKTHNIDYRLSYWLIIIQAALNAVSIALGWILASSSEVVSAVFLSISAGTFLAISTLEMLGPQFQQKQYKIAKFLTLMAAIAFVSTVWFIEFRVFGQEVINE